MLKVRIQTQDGSLLFYTMDEIARMAKEPRMDTDERVPAKKDAPATEIEIGTLFGIARSSEEFESRTTIQMPGGPLLGGFGPISSLPAFYVSWFPSERVAFGPEVTFGSFTDADDSFTSLLLGCRAAFFLRSSSTLRRPKDESRGAHYILGQGSLWNIRSGSDSETDFSAGLGLGRLWRIGPALILRMEAQYRRWFDAELNNFSLVFGLGTRLGGAGH